MPLIKSAIKKMHQDSRRYARNLRTKRAMRATLKALAADPSFDTFRAAQSAVDTAAKKHVISKSNAARRVKFLSDYAKRKGVKVVPVKQTATKTTAKKATSKSTAKASK